ncbi:MAG: type I-B CRISPR-associated protein Cas5b [Endomicrobium sp.]|jgi:CRISPR-associated protein Cas5h|nr:type I-B CRISPR-associated protein Cas5b [Endomicrobium sp.]
MKALKFEIWGDFAHFRKPYTTTSPLTFSLPPRTAMAGIIGAIIGRKKNDVICQNQDSFISISLLNAVKKTRMAVNLAKFPSIKSVQNGCFDLNKISNRAPQIRYEFLKDVKYAIYFAHNDKSVYESVKRALENHETVYTPYLGIAQLIANFKFTGEYEIQENNDEKRFDFKCIIPKKAIKDGNIELEDNAEYFTARIPNRLDEKRIALEYNEVVFERSGKKTVRATALPKQSWNIKETGENIIFL